VGMWTTELAAYARFIERGNVMLMGRILRWLCAALALSASMAHGVPSSGSLGVLGNGALVGSGT